MNSARRILADAGPRGVTLKAVAQDLGMRHGNLTYHFGSAAGLQSAVLEAMGVEVIGSVGDAVRRLDDGGATEREIVDLIFDAIATTGLIRLVSWLVSTGASDQMAPVDRVLADFIRRRGEAGSPHAPASIARMVMAVLVAALGATLMGTDLSRMLGLPDDVHRDLAAAQLRALRSAGR